MTAPSQISGGGLDSGRLFTTNLTFLRNNIGLRALYGSWQFDGSAVEAPDADIESRAGVSSPAIV